MKARIAQLENGLRDIRDGYDHEMQTHDHQPFRYGGHCRVCTAEKLIGKREDDERITKRSE
jgi:hypothetical protein